MGIGINSIGNYGVYSNKIHRPVNSNKISNVNTTPKTNVNTKPKEVSVLSDSERKFFSEKYPSQKDIVMDYHFYQRSGKMSGVAVGSIINRRG